MAKLKDGFYKLTASSIGSDLLVLLAGGGAKPISDFASSFNVKLWGLDFDGSKDVKGNLTLGYNKLYIGDGTDNFYIGWGASNMYCYHNYYGHYFSTKSGEVMSINSSGNVGIGTTNPFERLDVLGKIRSKGLIIHNHENANHWYYTKIATVYQNQSPNYLNGAMVFYTMYESHEAGSEVERMRISASGAVGIGVSNPGYQLHVNGLICSNIGFVKTGSSNDYILLGGGGHKAISTFAMASDLGNYVTINTDQTITGSKTFESASNDVGVSLKLRNKNWRGGMSTAIDFYTGGSKTAVSSRISDYMNGDGSAGGCLRFFTQSASSTNPNPNNLTERMRIDNYGFVRVYGNLNITSDARDVLYLNSNASGGPLIKIQQSGTDKAWYGYSPTLKGIYWFNANDTGIFLSDTNLVGIGITSPAQKLHVNGSIALSTYLYMPDNSSTYRTAIDRSGNNILFGYGLGVAGYDVYYTGYNVHLNAAGGWATKYNLTLLNNGNVGIGTSSPSEKLQISGGVFLQEVNNQWITPARVQIGRKDTTVYSDRCCVGTTDGNLHLDAYKGKMIYLNYYQQPGTYGLANTAVIIDTAGNTGIGVTPSYKLHVAGTIYSTGAVYANNFYGYLNGNISGSAASAGYTTRLYANSTTNLTTYPGDYSLAYSRFQADASNIFPCGNNANGVITAHLHAGEYYAQIGLSSNGRMYYRTMLALTLSSGVGWNLVAWSGESYTKSESDSRYVNVTGDTMTGNLTVPSLNSYYLFKTTDIAEGAANLGTLATAHTITFFRNGIMIPYKMDNANDGGMIRTKGASEDSCVFEMATWDDSGDGETIQFNYYSTTSQLTPTYSNTVPKVSGTLLNSGNWPSYIGGHGYLMNEYTIDATGLDLNTWYPVTMAIGACLNVRIEVRVSLNSGSKPSWSTHSSGFAVRKIWEVNGSGWGTNPVHRTVFVSDYAHASADPVRGMGDMGYSSTEYVYVRGGGRYYFYTSHNITPYLRTSTYVGTADPYYLAISPTTTAPGTIAGFLINRSMYASHFYENSDIKLKENINLISSSDNIPLLKEFNWKSDGKHSYGLIAQELEEMGYSELVEESGDHKTVNYSAALSLIVGKLQVKIKELEKEIEILKNKN